MSKSFLVEIKELEFQAILGILDFERVTPQKIVIDISFTYNYNDDKKDCVDYSKVVELIKTTMIERKFELIEEALIYMQKLLYKTFSITNLSIKIAKPDILDDCVVSISNQF